MKTNWTGERLETFIISRDTVEHLHRYAITLDYIKDKVVLDIACGEGYGSNIMSKAATKVFSVDIDENTVQAARKKYQRRNIKFLSGNATAIPIENNTIDVVVSFETIEHLEDHQGMLREIKRVLKENGLLIISTPDKLYYSDKKNYNNEFHVKELYKNEFKELINNSFRNLQLIRQTYYKGCSILEDDNKKNGLKILSGNFLNVDKFEIDPLYLIAIASDKKLNPFKISLFNGFDIINEHAENKINNIYNSLTYKVGRFILYPLKLVKKIF
jgi:ubiquinone/menaquinone biosynthesis C-methylase UbiE